MTKERRIYRERSEGEGEDDIGHVGFCRNGVSGGLLFIRRWCCAVIRAGIISSGTRPNASHTPSRIHLASGKPTCMGAAIEFLDFFISSSPPR